MQLITVSLLNGVFYGLLLFMLASGLTLIFSMMGVLNFAHGAFYMLGAYFAFQAGRWIGFWPALLIVGIGTFASTHGIVPSPREIRLRFTSDPTPAFLFRSCRE